MNLLMKMNFSRLKNIKIAQIAHKFGKNPLFMIGATAGLGFFLAANAKNSKKQNQGGV